MAKRFKKTKTTSKIVPQPMLSKEYGALDKVPEGARSYSFWDQVAFWFSAVSFPGAWYYGALMAGWKGLTGAFILIFGVNIVSFIPWALLGSMAAKHGASSMALARASFGLRGSVIPSIFYLLFGFGWGLINTFLAAIGLSFAFNQWIGWPAYMSSGHTPYMILYVIIVAFLQFLLAFFGHKIIKTVNKIVLTIFFLLGAYQTYIVLGRWGTVDILGWQPAGAQTAVIGPYTYTLTFALLADLLIAYNWTWEFIGDFSRFSPTKKAGGLGPFIGASISQIWWFLVGASGVAYLAITTGNYSPLTADPSSTTVMLGFGIIAVLIIAISTIDTNAANIYASALGISNIMGKKTLPIRTLLAISGMLLVFLSMIPLLSGQFVGFFIFFMDFLGAIVVPLWTLMLIDYFIVKKQAYSDDMFLHEKGEYWYSRGYNIPALTTLIFGTIIYIVIAYVYPSLREQYTAAIPTMVFVTSTYILWTKFTAPKKVLTKVLKKKSRRK